MDFEATIFPGFTSLGILDEIQEMMAELRCELEQFKEGSLLLRQCTMTFCGEHKEMQKIV